MESKYQSRNTNGYRSKHHQQPHLHYKIDCTILISNLVAEITIEKFHDIFHDVGRIVKVDVHRDEAQRMMSTATVVFERRSEAVRASLEFNGYKIGEHPMKIKLMNNKSSDDPPRMVQRPPHHSHWSRPAEDSMASRRYNQQGHNHHDNSKRSMPTYSRSQRGSHRNAQRPERNSSKQRVRDSSQFKRDEHPMQNRNNRSSRETPKVQRPHCNNRARPHRKYNRSQRGLHRNAQSKTEFNRFVKDEHPMENRIMHDRSQRETHIMVQGPHHRHCFRPAEDSMEISRENSTSHRGQRPEHDGSNKRNLDEEAEKPRKRECSELSEGELEDDDDGDEIPRTNHYFLPSGYFRNVSYSQRDMTRREQVKDEEVRKRSSSPLSEGELVDEDDEDEKPKKRLSSPMSKGELKHKMDDHTLQSSTDSRTPSPGDDKEKEARKMTLSSSASSSYSSSMFEEEELDYELE